MQYEEITGSILSCAFAVSRELGSGFLESVYENALALALAQKGHRVEKEKALQVRFRGAVVGDYIADLVVEDVVVVELKAVRALAPEHEAQVINYLKASGIEVGLLLNFGTPRLGFRRLTRCQTKG
jgi:GxxExxY protein